MKTFNRLLLAFFLLGSVVHPLQAAPSLTEMKKQIVCDCPSCGKQTVDQCHSGCARGMTLASELQKHISDGDTEEQILKHMAADHGEHILGVPSQENFWGRMAPIMPFAILMMGLVPMVYIMKTRQDKVQKTGGKSQPKAAPPQDDRLDAALKDFDY
ncbi:MAG TPA: cytochrome c-type biogenesis protein CcmH [Abditibacteriaceae bacterium]|jgi:cytochrome c-type biogenesis protein CcmH/NrfF